MGCVGRRDTWILERGVGLLITKLRHAIGRACRQTNQLETGIMERGVGLLSTRLRHAIGRAYSKPTN